MITKNPRIIMLVIEYHPIFTGHGIYLQQLCKHLYKNNCNISILAADFNELPSREIIDDVQVYRFKFSHGEKFWEAKLAARVIKFLILNINKYDILHIHGHLDIYGLLTLFNFLLRKHTISQMVLLGSDDPLTLIETYKFMRIRFKILTLMDRFICISSMLGKSYYLAGLPIKKLLQIPQGVDINRFKPVISTKEKNDLKNKLNLTNYDQIVVFVGAIVERKGVDWLVEAWCHIQEKHPKARLLLVGQGKFDNNDVNMGKLNSFVEYIKDYILKNNLNVLMLGKHLNVEQYLRCADIFVLPSRKEGFGNVILEGMATGLPVVVTFMDGVSLETVIHGENGFIVNSVSELADAIIKLLDDKELSHSMGKVGRKRATETFSLDRIAERYANLYFDTIKG